MQTLKGKIIAILTAITIALGGGYAVGDLGGSDITKSMTVLDGVTTTATSRSINVEGAKRISLYFTLADIGATDATSTFAVTASLDDTNYVTYNKLIDNVANSNSQDLTRVASYVSGANGTAMYSMNLEDDIIRFFKVSNTVAGSGTTTATVKALINY